MDSLPELARDATEAVKGRARNLLPWLPDPYSCDECGSLCNAEFVYNPKTAAFDQGACPAWVCPSCGFVCVRVEPWYD